MRLIPHAQARRLYWFLALPVIIFIVTISWLIYAIYHDADRHEQVLKQAFEIKYLHARVQHGSELLPLTLRHVLSGKHRIETYQQQRAQVDSFALRLRNLSADSLLLNVDRNLGQHIFDHYQQLRSLEDHALADMPRSTAGAVFDSAAYIAGNNDLNRRITQLAQELEHAFHWVLTEDTRRVHARILTLLVLVLLLAVVWFALFARARSAHLDLDIKEQELSQRTQALWESSARLSAILNNVIDGIVTIDTQGVIESVNPAMEDIFGYSEAELIGQRINMLMPQDEARQHDGYLRHYLKTGEKKIIGIGRKVTGVRKDGTQIPLDLAVSEMYFGDKRMFSGLIRDLSKHPHTPLTSA
jgi:PAS domain S-box-containing protein